MNIDVPDDVPAEKTECFNNFTCLSQGRCGDRDLCDVEYADGESILFLSSKQPLACPHRVVFAGRQICKCPTHFAIHGQHGR